MESQQLEQSAAAAAGALSSAVGSGVVASSKLGATAAAVRRSRRRGRGLVATLSPLSSGSVLFTEPRSWEFWLQWILARGQSAGPPLVQLKRGEPEGLLPAAAAARLRPLAEVSRAGGSAESGSLPQPLS